MGYGIAAPNQEEQPHGQDIRQNSNPVQERCVHIAGLNVNSLPAKIKFDILEDYIDKFDIICLSETKTDATDEQNLHFDGFTIRYLHRKNYKSKSGGVATLFRDSLFEHVTELHQYVNNGCVQWFKIGSAVIGTEFVLGTAYVVPEDSSYHSGEEFDVILENMVEIQNDLGLPFWLAGDFNARTGNLDDFIELDECVADSVGIDSQNGMFLDTEFFNSAGIKQKRENLDKVVNKSGKKLLDLCKYLNLLIINGRVGQDKHIGQLTCGAASTVDYMIASPDLLPHALDFWVDQFDSFLSDKHCPTICRLNSNAAVTSAPQPSLPLNNASCSPAGSKRRGTQTSDNTTLEDNTGVTNYHSKWAHGVTETFINSFDNDQIASVKSKLDKLKCRNVSKEDIDLISNEINSLYRECVLRTGLTKQVSNKTSCRQHKKQSKPFFTKECRESRNKYLKAKNSHRKYQSDKSK